MRITIITPCYNSGMFIEKTIRSILAQRETPGVEIEYIVVDGASKDNTLEILGKYKSDIDKIISERDNGPASAINKGLRLATGDIIGWLNADDFYEPFAVKSLLETIVRKPGKAIYFGKCRITDTEGKEIRHGITRFKNAFFPFSCRPLIQSINYISQPAMFFSRTAYEKAGGLREDMKAAFDYDFTLRLWREGGAAVIKGAPISNFRWYPNSISGSTFRKQFQEEYDAAVRDAGRFSPQRLAHFFVKSGIIWAYSRMEKKRKALETKA